MQRTGTPDVFLDLTHRGAEFIRRRFPRVYETCLRYGVDISQHPAPVHPAAHYAMGGVRTDLEGRTTVRRLYAAGEVACTGVHGANRLASNSLLEGLVFGARAGSAMREQSGSPSGAGSSPPIEMPSTTEEQVRSLAWDLCGIIRGGEGLATAGRTLGEPPAGQPPDSLSLGMFELRNIHLVALLIARCALAREESRGAHYRSDFPSPHPEFQKHSSVARGNAVIFR
jgi:L-aspartate oxidase